MTFKRLSSPDGTLFCPQNVMIKKPLLDPFGWQYPSVKTIYLSMLYLFNLIQNIGNLPSFIFIKNPDCYNQSSTPSPKLYVETPIEKNQPFDQTNICLLLANTAGLMLLASAWMAYKHRLFFQPPHKLHRKYPSITLMSPEMIHFSHLTFLLNMLKELGSGEANQNVNPYLKRVNTSITYLNIGSLLIQGIISSISLITPFNLDQHLTNTSHRILKKLLENPPNLSAIKYKNLEEKWLKNRLKKLQECGFHSHVILNLLEALKTEPEEASYLKDFLNDLGSLKKDYSKRKLTPSAVGSELP